MHDFPYNTHCNELTKSWFTPFSRNASWVFSMVLLYMISHGLNTVTVWEKWTFIYTVNITRYLQILAGTWHENEECPYLQKSYLMSLFPITIPFNDHYKETHSSWTRNNIYNSFVKTSPVDIQKLWCFLSYWNRRKKKWLLSSVNRKLVVVVVGGGAVEAIIF